MATAHSILADEIRKASAAVVCWVESCSGGSLEWLSDFLRKVAEPRCGEFCPFLKRIVLEKEKAG